MKAALLKAYAALMLVSLFCVTASGQGVIKGKVIDRAEEPVNQADVFVTNDKTGAMVGKASTIEDGSFKVSPLPVGVYTVTVKARDLTVYEKVEIRNDGSSDDAKIKLIDPKVIHIPYLVNRLCGAMILFLLDVWLRRKGVKDTSLVWLYLSLLSWAIGPAMELLEAQLLLDKLPLSPQYYKYLFSPLSSLFFVLTAFRLSRVRDWFSTPKRRRLCRGIIFAVVLVISVVGLYLQFKHDWRSARIVDAVASSIAGGTLGLGLWYSFREYGNRILAWFAAFNFLIFCARQLGIAIWGTPTTNFYAPLALANTTSVILLFITLAVAWGLSDASRLKTVGIPKHVEAVAMFFDLRGSTRWANEAAEKNFHYVKVFIDEFREWAWEKAKASAQGRPKRVKFLGDGFMYVWEVAPDGLTNGANTVAKLACDLHAEYSQWVEENTRKFPWGTPDGLGVGVDVGPAIQLTFESGSEDYLGSPMNIAAKMQNLARPHGGVVLQEKVWKLLLDDIRNKFPKEGKLKLGKAVIPVRATGDVEF